MKTIILSFIIILTFAAVGWADDVAETIQIDWQDYDQALLTAANKDKHVIIYFYQRFCHACDLLENETFTDFKVVSSMNENFVPVKIRIDTRPDMAREFRIRGTPSVYFLDSRGKVVTYVVGFFQPDVFARMLHYVNGEFYSSMMFEQFEKLFYPE